MVFNGSQALFSASVITVTAPPNTFVATAMTTVSGNQAVVGAYTTAQGEVLGFGSPGDGNAYLYSGNTLNRAAADSSLHLLIGLSNTTTSNSSFTIDNGSTVTGNAGTNSAQAVIGLGAISNPLPSYLTGTICEAGIALGTAITGGEITAIHSNVSTFYGTP
jgi:hypothetical protein